MFNSKYAKYAISKSLVIALIVVIVVGVFSGFYMLTQTGVSTPKPAKTGYITITDMAGRTVEVPRPVKTVVTTIPDALRLVVMFGSVDNVVGVTSYVDKYGSKMPCVIAYPELLNAARIGMAREIDVEKIAEVNPDVVFLYTPYADLADTIEKNTGVPVVCVNIPSDSPEGLYKALRIVGKVLGEEEKAEEIINYFKAETSKNRKHNLNNT
jgi:iron complex transport system substrate-binding protein